MFRIRLILGFVVLLGLNSIILSQEVDKTALNPPPDFHIELRLAEPRSIYKLGEPVSVEFACYAENPAVYSSECAEQSGVDLVLTALGNARTSVSQIQTRWIRQSLCEPNPLFGTCGLSYDPPAVPHSPAWSRITLGDRVDEAFPISAGSFHVVVTTKVWLKGSEVVLKLSSSPVVFEVIDDPEWRSGVFAKLTSDRSEEHARKLLEFMPDLAVVAWRTSQEGVTSLAERHPDRAGVARIMRNHLLQSSDIGSNHFDDLFLSALALQLAAESPELYSRALKFQDLDVNVKPSLEDHADLRSWVAPRYRQLLLDVGNSMSVRKCTRQLMEDNDSEEKAEGLIEANKIDCGYKKMRILSNAELRAIMQSACLSPRFIREQLASK